MESYDSAEQGGRRSEAGMGPVFFFGGAFAVMIFAVLCLALFTAFTLKRARSELDLSQRYADSAALYYRAESLAASFLAELASARNIGEALLAAESSGAFIKYDGGPSFYASFIANVSLAGGLCVEAEVMEENGAIKIKVLEKKLVYSGVWSEDTGDYLPVSAIIITEE